MMHYCVASNYVALWVYHALMNFILLQSVRQGNERASLFFPPCLFLCVSVYNWMSTYVINILSFFVCVAAVV